MVAPCLVDTKAESLLLPKILTSMVLQAMSSTDLEKFACLKPPLTESSASLLCQTSIREC